MSGGNNNIGNVLQGGKKELALRWRFKDGSVDANDGPKEAAVHGTIVQARGLDPKTAPQSFSNFDIAYSYDHETQAKIDEAIADLDKIDDYAEALRDSKGKSTVKINENGQKVKDTRSRVLARLVEIAGKSPACADYTRSILREFLEDESEDIMVRQEAARGLAGDQSNTEYLLDFVKNGQGTSQLRKTIIEALGDLGDTAALTGLAQNQSDPDVQLAAVEALGKMKDEAAEKALIELARSGGPQVRPAAVDSLGRGFRSGQAFRCLSTLAKNSTEESVTLAAINGVSTMMVENENYLEIGLGILRRLAGGGPEIGEVAVYRLGYVLKNGSLTEAQRRNIVVFLNGLSQSSSPTAGAAAEVLQTCQDVAALYLIDQGIRPETDSYDIVKDAALANPSLYLPKLLARLDRALDPTEREAAMNILDQVAREKPAAAKELLGEKLAKMVGHWDPVVRIKALDIAWACYATDEAKASQVIAWTRNVVAGEDIYLSDLSRLFFIASGFRDRFPNLNDSVRDTLAAIGDKFKKLPVPQDGNIEVYNQLKEFLKSDKAI